MIDDGAGTASAPDRRVSPEDVPGRRVRVAQTWHAATATVAILALLLQLVLTTTSSAYSGGVPGRLGNLVSYFTIQSNVLVAVVATTLGLRPDRDGAAWRVVRLAAVVGITVTGVVYLFVLAPLQSLTGAAALADTGLHYAVPVLAVLGWLLFGPRGRTSFRTLSLVLVWPVAWLGYTLVRGEIVDWYPYPFIDAADLGYVRVFVNGLLVTLLLVAVGSAYVLLDRRLRTGIR